MLRLLKPNVVFWLCLLLAQLSFAQGKLLQGQGSSTAQVVDPYLQLAKYHYYQGHVDQALLTIEQAAFLWPVANSTDRYLFAAELLIEQKRFAEAQQAFNKVLGTKKALSLMGKVSFPLAQLHFARGNCTKALRLLKVSEKSEAVKSLQAFYIRSNCLAADASLSMAQLETLELDITQFLKEHKRNVQVKLQSMWLAYAYYNMSIAAQNLRMDEKVWEYFAAAIAASKGADESEAFIERIKLTQAYAKFNSNMYDEALELFASLDLDSLWLDQALLGYGWSAYYNYNSGLAIEAWRQLVHMPNRSMSVYEGMMAIPFALEKSKSFSRALTSYDFAVENYTEALQEIDTLQANLNLSFIRQHALEYVKSLESGKTIEPLHPLLGQVYVQEDFRRAVKRVGDIAYEKEVLVEYRKELEILAENSRWAPIDSSSKAVDTQLGSLQNRVDKYKSSIYDLRTSMLDRAMQNPEVNKEIRVRYNRYVAVKAIAEKYGVKSDKLQRLQGVILWQLYEAGEYPSENLVTISKLLAHQRLLQSRLDTFRPSLDAISAHNRPDTKEIALLSARIDLLDAKLDKVSNKAESYVMSMTMTALSNYEERIKVFQKQARIARARLREEFYQIGGAK